MKVASGESRVASQKKILPLEGPRSPAFHGRLIRYRREAVVSHKECPAVGLVTRDSRLADCFQLLALELMGKARWGLALKRRGGWRVVGVGRHLARLKKAQRLGCVDDITTDMARGVRDGRPCDLGRARGRHYSPGHRLRPP